MSLCGDISQQTLLSLYNKMANPNSFTDNNAQIPSNTVPNHFAANSRGVAVEMDKVPNNRPRIRQYRLQSNVYSSAQALKVLDAYGTRCIRH